MNHLQRVTEGKRCVDGKELVMENSTLATRQYNAHKLTNGGSDERRGVTDVVETFLLDEVSNRWGEVLVVGLDIVLQYQTAQRASRLI